MKDQKNYTPYYKPIDFIPIVGAFTQSSRTWNAREKNWKPIDYKPYQSVADTIMLLYHSAVSLGAVFSPLIYEGLESLFNYFTTIHQRFCKIAL